MKAFLSFSKRHPSAFLNPASFKLNRAKKKEERRTQRKSHFFSLLEREMQGFIVRVENR